MRHRIDAAGFTLIEMLVAITLMALLLLPLMRSFSSGLLVRSRSDILTEATIIAETEDLRRLQPIPSSMAKRRPTAVRVDTASARPWHPMRSVLSTTAWRCGPTKFASPCLGRKAREPVLWRYKCSNWHV